MKKKRQAKKTILRHMGSRDRSRRGDKTDIVKWWVVGEGDCHNRVLQANEKQWEIGTNNHCSLNL